MRQYKTLIICLFFLSIFCLSKVNAIVRDYSLIGKTYYANNALNPDPEFMEMVREIREAQKKIDELQKQIDFIKDNK